MEKSKSTHDCYRHLDSKCRCTVCGKTHHVIASDSNYSGLGRVNVACLRCGSSEAFEDSTGQPSIVILMVRIIAIIMVAVLTKKK